MPYVVTICKTCDCLTDSIEHGAEDEYCEAPDGFERVELFTEREVKRARASDPASVLAALLAENPEATVAAIEALLTSDEAPRALTHVINSYCPQWDRRIDWKDPAYAEQAKTDAAFVLSAACRSLLSKAPKENGDA
jgi:hypothetical protein